MRVAVTGASGFLGSHIVRALHRAGHEVVGVVRNKEKARFLEPDASLSRADIMDVSAMTAAFHGADAVIANAAVSPGWSKVSAEEIVRANVVGTRNTLQSAHAAGCSRVVLVSTVAIYKTRLFAALDEASPRIAQQGGVDLKALVTNPAYARSKAAAEEAAWSAAGSLDLQLTALRPGPIYGPRDHKLTARYGKWMRRRVVVAPTVRLPHVHAGDVAGAVVSALASPGSVGQAYNVTGPSASVYEVLRTWRRVAKGGAVVVPLPLPLGVRFDDRAARRDLGFEPRSIREGLDDTVRWFQLQYR